MKSANVVRRDVKVAAVTPFLVALGLLLTIPQLAVAQFGVAFSVTTSEVTGTCSLNGGSKQTINPIDSASASTNGVALDSISTESDTACGVNFFTSGAAANKAEADDTTTTDDAEAKDSTATLNILNGLLTYDSDETDHKCVATSSSSASCIEQALFTNIKLGGSSLPKATYTGPQTLTFTDLQLAGAGCDLLATYEGTLTLGELDPPAGQATNQTEFYALRVKTTETCLLPPFSIEWDIQANGGFVAAPAVIIAAGTGSIIIIE